MHYGSVCSGIEAASQAWSPLGWKPAFFSEIEKFPSAVLAHHYGSNLPGEPWAHNGVPNYGDMTNFKSWPDHAIDVLVGGTPCQSYSVAGLRAGLDDPRGSLMLTFGAIAAQYRPAWVVWENVPGVLSSKKGRDFASFLGLITGQQVCVPEGGWKNSGIVPGYSNAYGVAYRVLDAQHVRVGRFRRAVPQRRRRVFVIGYLGDWRRAAAVFFDGQSLRGDPAPSRSSRKDVAPTTSARPTGGGGLGTDFDLDGALIASGVAPNLTSNPYGDHESREGLLVASSLMAKDGRGVHSDMETFVSTRAVAATLTRGAESHGKGGYAGRRQEDDDNLVAHSLRGEGFDASEDGMGRGTPIIAHAIQAGALRENPASGPDGVGVQSELAYTLEARPEVQAVAWSIMPQNSGKDYKARQVDVAQPIMAGGPVGGNQGGDYIQQEWAVRRLTPIECARLQGFPDDYLSSATHRGKAPADGPMYKALGNSMAVNVMSWIGERIAMVDAL